MTYIYKSPLEERDGDFKVTDGLITGATNANWDDAHAKRVDSWTFPLLYSSNVASISLTDSGIDHGGLAGLGDDDHAQYFADTLTGVRDRDYSTTGIITAGTLTDGTASLTGGVGTGYTLISPVIAEDFSWTGDSAWDCSDADKEILIGSEFMFTFGLETWLDLNPTDNKIRFGNSDTDPTFDFLGTGTVNMGGDLDVTGNITTGQYIGDVAFPDLIEVDGDNEEVTVSGDLNLINSLTDAKIQFDGSGAFTGSLEFESDTSTFKFDKFLLINDTDDAVGRMLRLLKLDYDLSTGGTREILDVTVRSSTAGSGNIKGLSFDVRQVANTGTQSGALTGFFGQVYNSGNANVTGAVRGGEVSVANAGSGTHSLALGMAARVYIENGATGTISTAINFFSSGIDAEDGTINNAYGFYSKAHLVDTGTLENAYGLYLESQDAGSIANWAIYSLGGNSAHVGNVRIGDTTAPTYALEVAGVVKSESGRIPKTHLLTANTTLDETYHEVFCDTDSAGFTITLPAVPVGETYRIINTGSNTLTIDPNGNNIVGSAINQTLNSCDTLIITWQATKGWW